MKIETVLMHNDEIFRVGDMVMVEPNYGNCAGEQIVGRLIKIEDGYLSDKGIHIDASKSYEADIKTIKINGITEIKRMIAVLN